MDRHAFGNLFRHPEFTHQIRVCARCGVVRTTVNGQFHYFGKEHMGTGHERCPASFAGCGTSPSDIREPESGPVVDLEIADATVAELPLRERRQR